MLTDSTQDTVSEMSSDTAQHTPAHSSTQSPSPNPERLLPHMQHTTESVTPEGPRPQLQHVADTTDHVCNYADSAQQYWRLPDQRLLPARFYLASLYFMTMSTARLLGVRDLGGWDGHGEVVEYAAGVEGEKWEGFERWVAEVGRKERGWAGGGNGEEDAE